MTSQLPEVTRRNHYGHKIVALLIVVFIIAGLLILLLGTSVRNPNWQAMFYGLGISFVSFGATTIILSYFTNDFFGERMAERFRPQLDGYVGEVERITNDAMDRLPAMVEQNLRQVVDSFNEFVPLFSNCTTLGLANVYLTRLDAMREFSQALTSELERAELNKRGVPAAAQRGRLWFVSSSMKGFLDTSNKDHDGRRIIEWAAELAIADRLELKILMTAPDRGDERASQEMREEGDIGREIMANLGLLKDMGIQRTMIRLVNATPTVFAIATTEMMLINPYPYGAEAFRSFSLTVRRTPAETASRARERDIYEQYEQNHFLKPWKRAPEISDVIWDSLKRPATNGSDVGTGPLG